MACVYHLDFFYGFYNFSEISNINVDEAEWTPITESWVLFCNDHLTHVMFLKDITELNTLEDTHSELFI